MARELMRILACIDDTPTALRVIETAWALRPVFGGVVEAFHVGTPSRPAPTAPAARLDVPLTVRHGEVVPAITAAIASRDVVAGVLGARGEPAGARPCGHVAMAVVSAVDKPIVVVPPRAGAPGRPWERVLVPLDGRPDSALAVAATLHLLEAARIEIVVLHVFDDQTVPRFWDQAHHSITAWVDELSRRHEHATSTPTVELRVGSPGEQALGVASIYDVDAIVLGWARSFDEGRARTVCHALGESTVPVILLPVGPPAPRRRRDGTGDRDVT